jgi:hypothetical protein
MPANYNDRVIEFAVRQRGSLVRTKYNYLGKSQHSSDPLFAGRLADLFFSGQALTDDQIAAMVTAFPSPRFAGDPIVKTDGSLYQAYNDSIAADVGMNNITVRVTDQTRLSSDATLVINIPTGPPAAPLKLIATPGYAQINLIWTSSLGATSYKVKRSTTSGGPYVTIASSIMGTSYADTAAGKEETTYYYVVSAVNKFAESANSIEAGAAPSSSAIVSIANPGFELPATPSFIYNPSSGSWTFNGKVSRHKCLSFSIFQIAFVIDCHARFRKWQMTNGEWRSR